MKLLKACVLVATVLIGPLLVQTNIGCKYTPPSACDEDCQNPPGESNPNSYVCSCTCSTSMVRKQFPVSFLEDDAEQKLADNSVGIASNDLDFSTGQLVGVRFRNLTIPSGAAIVKATVQFSSTSAGSGPLSVNIRAQAADNAPAFTTTNNSIFSRPTTTAFATWNPNAWNADETGANELTSDLTTVVQEVVDRAGWAEGNALVLIFASLSGAGVRHAESHEGRLGRVPVLVVDYSDPGATSIGPQELPVCMTAAANPNLNGGTAPTDMELGADCTDRVDPTLMGLAEACGYPSQCTCTFEAGSQKFATACDEECVENAVDTGCADFDPVNGNVDATNAPGDVPVCLANSPLAYGLYGRRTRCEVTGEATVEVEDNTKKPSVAGVLQFLGTPCPGGTCGVGLEYRLDIGSVTFSNFWGSATFDQLAGLGKSTAGNEAMLSMTGEGTFLQSTAEVSARGRRVGGDQMAYSLKNEDVINVTVLFGTVGPTCALSGNLVGSVDAEFKRCEPFGPNAGEICADDDACADVEECTDEVCNCEQVSTSNLRLAVDLAGDILNQPPTADAGDDQTIECTDDAATQVLLDGTGSSDLDDNISLFSWRRGNRVGEEVGIAAQATIQQVLGAESYFLRVIDAFAQTDEDSTQVEIIDTTPPQLNCAVAKHVLEILNHNLVNVGLAASSQDACEGRLPITVKVFGDERDQADTGDGVFSPDAKNFGVGALRLRSERRNAGDGRVYLIVVESTDTTGNRGFDCCTVIVPKSPRLQSSLQSAENQAKAAKNFCLANDGTAPPAYFVIGNGPVVGTKQ